MAADYLLQHTPDESHLSDSMVEEEQKVKGFKRRLKAGQENLKKAAEECNQIDSGVIGNRCISKFAKTGVEISWC